MKNMQNVRVHDKLLCIEMFDRGWWSKEQVESLLTAWESQYKRYCEDTGY